MAQKPAKKASKKALPKKTKKWSAAVSRNSDAMDLKSKVFKSKDPKAVAKSLKNSSEHSTRRKGTPLQSAMSMLNFYINRAGRNLPAGERKILTRAKVELHNLYKKTPDIRQNKKD